jgi:enoyl-CoA hydratase/carnithine racemase
MARLEALAGVGVATEMILTGRRISGEQAHRHGIAQHVVTADRLEDELGELVTELSKAAPLAQRLAKEAMRVRGDRHRMVDAAAQALCIASDDTQARIAAQLGATSAGTS